MKFLNDMERKFGRYAVKNLPAIMIGLYVAGYILSLFTPQVLRYLTLEPYLIVHGQIWRIVTWLIIPPDTLNLFTVIMLLFYFSIGQTLERTWGTFRYNVYIFMGIIFTVLGAFILFAICAFIGYPNASVGGWFSTYYINMSIFLAFAMSYPDMQVLLYFFIPVKMKWMGLLYGVLTVYTFIQTRWPGRVAIIASLLNFFVFMLMTRNLKPYSPKEIRRKATYKQAVKRAASPAGAPRHRCAVCGRTEKDDPNLEFRFCSKCDGAYEYCQDHLFSHVHIHKQ